MGKQETAISKSIISTMASDDSFPTFSALAVSVHMLVVRAFYTVKFQTLSTAKANTIESKLSIWAVHALGAWAVSGTILCLHLAPSLAPSACDAGVLQSLCRWAAPLYTGSMVNLGAFEGLARWAGVALIEASALLLWATHAALGKSWSPIVAMKEDQELVTHGPFHWVRHPMVRCTLASESAPCAIAFVTLTAALTCHDSTPP
jgi:protein-S-isoprenylcysteine O-methyltransferase Ste14